MKTIYVGGQDAGDTSGRSVGKGDRKAQIEQSSKTSRQHRLPAVLNERKRMDAYRARPDDQQNDYIGWITRAKRDETKEKCLSQILDELEAGMLYMNMLWTKDHTLFNRYFPIA